MQKTGNGLKIESASIVFCVRHSSDHPSRVQKLGEREKSITKDRERVCRGRNTEFAIDEDAL